MVLDLVAQEGALESRVCSSLYQGGYMVPSLKFFHVLQGFGSSIIITCIGHLKLVGV